MVALRKCMQIHAKTAYMGVHEASRSIVDMVSRFSDKFVLCTALPLDNWYCLDLSPWCLKSHSDQQGTETWKRRHSAYA